MWLIIFRLSGRGQSTVGMVGMVTVDGCEIPHLKPYVYNGIIWDKPSIQLVSTGDSDFAGPSTVFHVI